MKITIENFLDSIGNIDDMFLEEAETAGVIKLNRKSRKHIAKYGAAGLAVSFGVAVAYWVYKSKKAA